MQLITDFQREVDKNQLIEWAFWNLVSRDDMALVVTYLIKANPEIGRSIGMKILADAGKKLGEQWIQN